MENNASRSPDLPEPKLSALYMLVWLFQYDDRIGGLGTISGPPELMSRQLCMTIRGADTTTSSKSPLLLLLMWSASTRILHKPNIEGIFSVSRSVSFVAFSLSLV